MGVNGPPFPKKVSELFGNPKNSLYLCSVNLKPQPYEKSNLILISICFGKC